MPDFSVGLLPDPVGLLTLVLTIVAGSILALGLLEILLFALLSILLSWKETRPKIPSLLGFLIPAFAIGMGPGGLPAQEGNPQEIPTIEARFTRIFSSDSLNIGGAALSPDGRWLAFDGFTEGIGNIWVVSTQGGDPIRLTSGQNVNQTPLWFPSGDRIAFLSNQVAEGQGHLFYVMSIPIDPETGQATGPARQVSLEPAREPSISPDGRWIAYGTYIFHGTLKVIPSNGGAARTLFDQEGPSPRDPTWSTDSEHVYFDTGIVDSEARRVMRVSVDGGEAAETSVIPGRTGALAPDETYRVSETENEAGQGPMLELMDPQGQVLGRVPLHRNMSTGYPRGFTPDGRGVTAVVRDLVAPIFVAPLDGGPARQISDVRAYERVLGWTPDSRQVFYSTRLNGRAAVLRTPWEGGPSLEIPLPLDAGDPLAVPSADGRYLAYALGSSADTGRTVMVRRISDGETRVLTDAYVRGLRPGREVEGPGGGVTDGEGFLFLERHGDQIELRSSPPEGPSRLIRSVAPGQGIFEGRHRLGVHGDWVAYPESQENLGDSATLLISTSENESAHELVTVPGGLEGIYWSHDRRWIVAGHYTPLAQGFGFDLLLVGVTPEGTLASELRFLETEAWIPHHIQWLPDNQTLALFGMDLEGILNYLWLIPIREGESAVPVSLGDPSGIWSLSVSPDGRHVAFGREVPRGSSIWIVNYGEFLRERKL